MMTSDARVRMRVAAAVAVTPVGEDADRGTNIEFSCAVGEVVPSGEAHDSYWGVWARGGTSHAATRLAADGSTDHLHMELPVMSVCPISRSIADDMALLANDIAAAMRVAEIVAERRLKAIAIVTPTARNILAACMKLRLSEIASQQEARTGVVHTLLIDELVDAEITSMHFDCCIDLSCTNASLDFATRQLEPLGSLLLLSSETTCQKATPIDMNTVVVNELRLLYVSDFQSKLRDAVKQLSTNYAAYKDMAQHLKESGSIRRPPRG